MTTLSLPNRGRSNSAFISDQELGKTCYAHAVSRCLTRYIFLLTFNEDITHDPMENCEELYKTTTCKDIFACLDNPDILCRPLNTILALIFTMFYKIITFHSGDQCGGYIVEGVRKVFEFCKDLNGEKFYAF
jgi:hypothetical protein